jgi:hypothetical protein
MDVKSFSKLNHILSIYLDNYARVSTEVDMDALWEFFFDTGFIYGEKYEHLHPYREAFKETYRKLYQENPDIARHFVYEKNGKIYGHIAMVHAYEPSWVIHHFSARPMESRIPGIMILKQITHYINDFCRLSSAGMDYVMTYYRPENRIVDKIFGGFARHLNNFQGSSLDLFSYMHFQKCLYNSELPVGWLVRECTKTDFIKLNAFYQNHSGGLLLDALGLEISSMQLEEKFAKAGFKRMCKPYCICHEEHPVAFLIVNQTDLGLNLSDLINGIKIIITDNKKVTPEILFSAISQLSITYEEENIPLLIYPDNYLTDNSIDVKKCYQLWILNNKLYSEQYLEYMYKNFRIKYRNQ